ncbi:MAG: RES domain-containing protein [Sphingomonadales bacterium]|nr:RES domain-containing protein [Sphingomonadales bacterium]
MSIPIVFTGQGYRIISRAWAHDPVSGVGASTHGGRYNPRGMPAFYCSLDAQTAYAEYTASLLDRPGWLCCLTLLAPASSTWP